MIDRLQQEINQIAFCRRIKSSSNTKILKKQTNMEEGRKNHQGGGVGC
jgi:hypothetical protein